MTYDITYDDTKEYFYELIESPPAIMDCGVAQATWLYEFDESKLQEAERLNVLLPLIKWEVENDCLTEWMRNELYLYYKDYTEGKLDGILADYEAGDVIRDLTGCYKKVFG